MKVKELREELKKRGLDTKGLKAALEKRYDAAIAAEKEEAADAAEPEPKKAPAKAKAKAKPKAKAKAKAPPKTKAKAKVKAKASASERASSAAAEPPAAAPVATAPAAPPGATAMRYSKAAGNVSGRNWKMRPQSRTSSQIKKFGLNRDVDKTSNTTPWSQLQAKKAQRKRIRELQQSQEQGSADRKRQKREAQEERKRRRLQNEFNAATTQTLGRNAAQKLRTMNKKQLRQIKKTRMNSMGVLEYVSPFEK